VADCISPGSFLLFFICVFFFLFFFSSVLLLYDIISLQKMSIAASREPRLSKPGPLITDPSNTALPATSSHRAAAAAEAERRIRAEIDAQRAAEGSPIITPPPETPISTTNQHLSPIIEDDEDKSDKSDKLGPRDNLTTRKRSTKSKRARARNDMNSQY
jgi:hypothetical protein